MEHAQRDNKETVCGVLQTSVLILILMEHAQRDRYLEINSISQ